MKKLRIFFKGKKLRISLGSFMALLLVFGIWGGFHYSKASVIKRYVAAYSRSGSSFENIKEYLVWSDNKERVTNDQAKYARFSGLNQADAQQLTETLETAEPGDDLYVTRVGRKFLVFPDYRIAMKPLSLTIKTNIEGLDILLNKKKVSTSDSDHYSLTVQRLPRANYTASVDGHYSNRDIELSKTYDGKNGTLDLSVTFKHFTVTSNLTDGELYFDDTKMASLTDGQYEVDNYPLTNSAQVYVKKTFADGDLVSKKESLSKISNGSTVALDADNLLDAGKAGQVLVASFDKLVNYVSSNQDPADLATVFEDGANNDFYKGLKESIKAKFQTDQRKASSFTIPNIVIDSMSQVGKESYLLNFSASYDFYYDKATDSSKNTQGHVVQQLTGKVTLKKSGEDYLIAKAGEKNITVTSEENQVKAESVFPDALLGTWMLENQDRTISMTFDKDGTVTKKVDYKDSKQTDTTSTAKVRQVEEKEAGLYLFQYQDGTDTSTFVPNGGIGGSGVKYAFGVKLDGDKVTSVVWQAAINADYDYSKPLLGDVLSKK